MFPTLRPRAAALLIALLVAQPAAAQTRPERPPEAPPACDAERAVRLVRQQLMDSRALADGAKRADVLTRAADLLWPFDEAQARASLAEAFEVASSYYREHGEEVVRLAPKRADATYPGRPSVRPDPRMAVIRVAARRDHALAERLTARAAQETRERALADAEKEKGQSAAAAKLLSMADSFVESDLPLALTLARESLRMPTAGRMLGRFVYDVARVERAAADAFYADALSAYANADVASLLELSAYPFALFNNIGLRSGYNVAGETPRGFAPSPELQRQFVAALLRLSERRLQAAAGQPPPQDDPQRASEAELIYAALTSLETLYGASDKSYAARAEPLRQMAGGMLTGNAMRRATATAGLGRPSERPRDTSDLIDRVMAYAEKLKDPEARDRHIVMGLWGYMDGEASRLEAAAEKISDEMVRGQFLESVHFMQAQRALRAGRAAEAARAAEKVRPLDQRAALVWDLMWAELKQAGDAPEARALAESVYQSAERAPESEERVRALLGLAYYNTQLDPARAPALLAEAVAAINRLPEFDLSGSSVIRTVDGRTYSFYTFAPAPGFSLEAVLREVAARDLDAALEAAAALDDRQARARAVLSFVSKCMQEAAKTLKPAPRMQPPAAKRTEAVPKAQDPPRKRP
ncbi:MAG TPA: hypothetical protein VF508_04635 [Pyrinomonadaceae bacterium]